MGSSQQERLAMVLTSGKDGSPGSRVLEALTPASRNGGSSLSDESVWLRLREAGFDEEYIKRRDKAALIAYIAKLEAEIFDYQHHMGLLILEKKDWASKYEQVKGSVNTAETTHKLDQATHLSALAEARKREESLKKALGIEKECIANIEKTLHEMRAESAETKIAAESKMAEAHSIMKDAQKKFLEAEAKLHAAESLQAEASRYNRAAERKLQEVEERQDELRRRLISFKSECDAKEKEISLERQSLSERQKIVQQGQERLLEGQALLNQREEYIFGRSQELSRLEKELEASKTKIEEESKSLNEEKSNLDLKLAAISTREEAVRKRETILGRKDQELINAQEKLASKEHDEIQRHMAEHEASLQMRKFELEAEIEQKRKSMEDEMETKRRACELREVDLSQREDLFREKEYELEVQLRVLVEKEQDVTERLKLIEEKEENLSTAEKATELEKMYMQKEKDQIKNMKLDLQKSMDSLENKRKEVEEGQMKLEASKSERNELLVLEMKLKEEIDSIRAKEMELMAEAEELNAEKSKFEIEWELIDEKRDELRKEAERASEERKAVSKFLKDERDSLKLEKDALRDQFKRDVESLSREREAFVSKMEEEHSELFCKIQQERASFVQDIEMQKREMENCINKRRDEIESYLREKEEAFEQEKAKELHYISSLKEMVAQEQEHIALELKRLDKERIEIALDRERRKNEQDELKKSIEELQIQREKLKEQRELLHVDREKINVQIQHLNKLEDLKIASENVVLSEKPAEKSAIRNLPTRQCVNSQTITTDGELNSHAPKETPGDWVGSRLLPKQVTDSASTPSSAPFSWIKRCTEMIFKHSPEKLPINLGERSEITKFEDAKLLEDKYSQYDKNVVSVQVKNVQGTSGIFLPQMSEGKYRNNEIFSEIQPVSVIEEPKVILEMHSIGENVRKASNLESATKTDVSKNSIDSYPDQGILSGRKRHNYSSSPDNLDTPLKSRQNVKTKKQRRDAPKTLLEETTSNCAVLTQTIPAEDENGLASFNQTSGNPEVVENFVKENHKTLDDDTEHKGTDTSAEPAKLLYSQNTSVLEQDNVEGRGSDGHAYSPRVGNGVTSHGSKAQRRVQGEAPIEGDGYPEKENSQNIEGHC